MPLAVAALGELLSGAATHLAGPLPARLREAAAVARELAAAEAPSAEQTAATQVGRRGSAGPRGLRCGPGAAPATPHMHVQAGHSHCYWPQPAWHCCQPVQCPPQPTVYLTQSFAPMAPVQRCAAASAPSPTYCR